MASYPLPLIPLPGIRRGDPYALRLWMSSSITDEVGGPKVDLLATFGDPSSGGSWRATLRASDDATTGISFTVDPSGLSAGWVRLDLTPATTRTMTAGKYSFDVEAVSNTGVPLTIWVTGAPIQVTGDFTRPAGGVDPDLPGTIVTDVYTGVSSTSGDSIAYSVSIAGPQGPMGPAGAGATNAVRFDSQSLTTPQQAQARGNIGAVGGTYVDTGDALRVRWDIAQGLTSLQKAQALANVGGLAVPSSFVAASLLMSGAGVSTDPNTWSKVTDVVKQGVALLRPAPAAGQAFLSDFVTHQTGIDATKIDDLETLEKWRVDNSYTKVVLEPFTTTMVRRMTSSNMPGVGGFLESSAARPYVGYPGLADYTLIKLADGTAMPLTASPALNIEATSGNYTIQVYDGATLLGTTANINAATDTSFTSAATKVNTVLTAASRPSAVITSGGQAFLPQDSKNYLLKTVNVSLVGSNIGGTSANITTASGSATVTVNFGSYASTTTSGSPTVTCASVASADVGRTVTGTGIPAGSFVGPSSVAGATIRLSSSPTTQVDVNASASGSPTLTVGALTNGQRIIATGIPTTAPVYVYRVGTGGANKAQLTTSPSAETGHGVNAIASGTVTATLGADVSVDNSPPTNPWQAIISTYADTGTPSERFSHVTIDFNGANQAYNFQGMRLTGVPKMTFVKIKGSVGTGNSPNKETSQLRLYHTTGCYIADCEIDGQGIGALNIGMVQCVGTATSWHVFERVKSHDAGWSHGLGSYKSAYVAYLDCRTWGNGVMNIGAVCHGVNVEDPAGPYFFYNTQSWGHSAASWRFNVDDGTAARTDFTMSACSGWGSLYGAQFDGTWASAISDNGVPNAIRGTVGAGGIDFFDNTSQKSAVTITNGNSSVAFASAHGYSIGDATWFSTVTAAGFTAGTAYFVVSVPDSTHVTLSQRPGGDPVTPTSGGTATVSTLPPGTLNALSEPLWTNSTCMAQGKRYRVPSGGVAASRTARVSGSSFNDTEALNFNYEPGGHMEIRTSSGTILGRHGIAMMDVEGIGGAGGGGSGAAGATGATSGNPTGGSGASAANVTRVLLSGWIPGVAYAYTVGAGGPGGAQVAANTSGANGNNGSAGSDSTLTGPGGVVVTAAGGSAGAGGNITGSTTGGGSYGAKSNGTALTTTNWVPGCGGSSTSGQGTGAAPGPGGNVVGGAGAKPASGTVGGVAGSSRQAPGQSVVTQSGSGGAGTADGAAGVTPTEPGCGGPGGGGGANGTGKGGAGATGAAGAWIFRY